MKYILKFVLGDYLGVFVLIEFYLGLDVGSFCIIVIKKNGKYVLNGLKIFIMNGGVVDIYIMFVLIVLD